MKDIIHIKEDDYFEERGTMTFDCEANYSRGKITGVFFVPTSGVVLREGFESDGAGVEIEDIDFEIIEPKKIDLSNNIE